MSHVFSIPSDEINLYPLVNGHVPVLSVPSQEYRHFISKGCDVQRRQLLGLV